MCTACRAIESPATKRNRVTHLATIASMLLGTVLPLAVPNRVQAELLYLQPPFDEITLDANNQGAILQVQPLNFPGGKLPREADRTGDLEFELLDRPGEKYAVPWLNIVAIRFFPELVLAEANGLVAERKYDEAQPYFQFLEAKYPKTPGLGEAIESFLYQQIGLAYSDKRYDEALAMLVVLHGRNPSRPGVSTAYQRVTLELVKARLAERNYPAARGLLRNLAAKYPAVEATAVAPVEAQLQAQAAALVAQAKAAQAAGRLAEAHPAILAALEVWPQVAEGSEMAAAIFAQYPVVGVAVRSPLAGPPQDRFDDWAAARTWPLVAQGFAVAGDNSAESPDAKVRFVRPSSAVVPAGDDQEPKASIAIAEVVEQPFADVDAALLALRRGEVSIVDRLRGVEIPAKPPADITVRRYSSPTVHVLVPNPRRPIAASRTLRRAVLYGTDREGTLHRSFLGGGDIAGCMVISGPLPNSEAGNPPTAGYDTNIPLAPYQPLTALTLARLAAEELPGDAAGKLSLKIAHPRDPQIERACQSIERQLRVIGIDVVLAPEPVAEGDFDLRYTELRLSDPAHDLGRLFGLGGIAETANPALLAAIAAGQKATTAEEQATQLKQVHQLAAAELPVIPLWQLADHFAVHSSIQAVAAHPASLYEQIDAWQVAPRLPSE
jgi:tetratricopeptide (TPR) repeat protein